MSFYEEAEQSIDYDINTSKHARPRDHSLRKKHGKKSNHDQRVADLDRLDFTSIPETDADSSLISVRDQITDRKKMAHSRLHHKKKSHHSLNLDDSFGDMDTDIISSGPGFTSPSISHLDGTSPAKNKKKKKHSDGNVSEQLASDDMELASQLLEEDFIAHGKKKKKQPTAEELERPAAELKRKGTTLEEHGAKRPKIDVENGAEISNKKKRKKNQRASPESMENGVSSTTTTDKQSEAGDVQVQQQVPAETKSKKKGGLAYTLLDRMLAAMPAESAGELFSDATQKLDWDSVRFNELTVDDCQRLWRTIVKNVRKYRTLPEIISDARSLKLQKFNRFQSHDPDRPKRPTPAYMRFFSEKRDAYLKKHPNASVIEIAKKLGAKFRKLSPSKRLKYETQYAEEKKKFDAEMEKYCASHPKTIQSTSTTSVTLTNKPTTKSKPMAKNKPMTACEYYAETKIRKKVAKHEDGPRSERRGLLKRYREHWNMLSNEDKVKFINRALRDEEDYQRRLQNGDVEASAVRRPIKLSKLERLLKDDADGVMRKPPSNGYSMFAAKYMQKHAGEHGGEMMKICSQAWHALADDRKAHYSRKAAKANAKYRAYLESLGLLIKPPKVILRVAKFDGEPVKPPTMFMMFVQQQASNLSFLPSYRDRVKECAQLWEMVSDREKDELRSKRNDLVRKYERDLAAFKKSLKPEQLQAYEDAHLNKNSKQKERMIAAAADAASAAVAADGAADEEDFEVVIVDKQKQTKPSKKKTVAAGSKNVVEASDDVAAESSSKPSEKKKATKGKKNEQRPDVEKDEVTVVMLGSKAAKKTKRGARAQ